MTAASDTGEDRATDDAVAIIPFDLDGTLYCVCAARVRAVLDVDTTTVDRGEVADPWFTGSIELEGDRIRIVDLGRVVQPTRSSIGDDGRVVVFDQTDETGSRFGWLVDDVDVTTTVPLDALDRPRSRSHFVLGHVGHEMGELVWLDDRAINE